MYANLVNRYIKDSKAVHMSYKYQGSVCWLLLVMIHLQHPATHCGPHTGCVADYTVSFYHHRHTHF